MSEPRRPADPLDPGARDDERDAWLREALRHAPDSSLSPPAILRDSILSQARAAVAVAAVMPRDAAASPARRRLQSESTFAAFWSWLARPPVAAGFASVMAATLVGLMWWDRPMDEAMPQPPTVSPSSSPLPSPASPSPSPSTSASPSSPVAATAPVAESFATQKAVAPRQPDAPAAIARRAVPPALDLRERAEPATGHATRDAAVPFPAEAKAERSALKSAARDELRKDDRSTSVMPAPAPTPAPAQAAAPMPTPAPALADGAVGILDKARALPERARQGPGAADAFAQAVPGAGLRAAPRRSESATPATLAKPVAAARPLAPLLAAAAADASRVTRVGSDGRVTAADDALLRWLVELDTASAGLWQALDAAESSAGSAVDLRLDGQPAATIRVDASTATLSIRSGSATRLWRADIGAATAERLRNSLPR